MLYLFEVISHKGNKSNPHIRSLKPNSSEPGDFGSLGPKPLEKKKKEPEPLGKKSGAGAATKLAGSSALFIR